MRSGFVLVSLIVSTTFLVGEPFESTTLSAVLTLVDPTAIFIAWVFPGDRSPR